MNQDTLYKANQLKAEITAAWDSLNGLNQAHNNNYPDQLEWGESEGGSTTGTTRSLGLRVGIINTNHNTKLLDEEIVKQIIQLFIDKQTKRLKSLEKEFESL